MKHESAIRIAASLVREHTRDIVMELPVDKLLVAAQEALQNWYEPVDRNPDTGYCVFTDERGRMLAMAGIHKCTCAHYKRNRTICRHMLAVSLVLTAERTLLQVNENAADFLGAVLDLAAHPAMERLHGSVHLTFDFSGRAYNSSPFYASVYCSTGTDKTLEKLVEPHESGDDLHEIIEKLTEKFVAGLAEYDRLTAAPTNGTHDTDERDVEEVIVVPAHNNPPDDIDDDTDLLDERI